MTHRDTHESSAAYWSVVTALSSVFIQTLFFHKLGITASVITGMCVAGYYATKLAKDSIFSGVTWLLLIGIASSVMHVVTLFLFANQLTVI